MTTRTRWLVFLVSTPLVALVAVGGLLGAAPSTQLSFSQLRVFNDVLSLVYGAYVEDVDVDRVMDGAMRGLADSLDSSSAYLTPREVELMDSGAALPAADVGLTVTRQYYLRVVGVREDSPAARAGIRSGDLIRMIDGQATRDISEPAGMRMLAGAPGSKVTVVVIRDNPADPHEITLTREAFSGAPVTGRRLPGGEAYVRVKTFRKGATQALRQAIGALKLSGSEGLLIDVRDVADGDAAEAIAAARLFVKSGPIATLKGREAEPTVTAAGAGDGTLAMRTVVLVSNGTARAAEIFASALSAAKRADLVGQPTAGLAAEQKLVRLPQGHGLWMTYARYLGPDGNPIHGDGLSPDVGVSVPFVGFGETPPADDPTLTQAIARLKAGSGT